MKDETNAMYDIEVQSVPHVCFIPRILRYWLESYNSQLERGDDYRRQHPVRSVIITGFSIFPQLNDLHTVFEIRARENPAVRLTDHLQIHFLRLGDMRQNPAGLEYGFAELDDFFRLWF